MLELSWIIAILQLYSQVAELFGNAIVKRINIRLFDLLARFHYILNLPHMNTLHHFYNGLLEKELVSGQHTSKHCYSLVF